MKSNKINVFLAFILGFVVVFLSLLKKDITLLLFCLYLVLPFVFKIKPVITLIYLIFGFIAIFLGLQIHLYKTTSWFDIFSHFIWGIVSGLLALIALLKLKVFDKKNIIFTALFIFVFSLATSGLWEVAEFTIDNIFNQDMQRMATGVNDTMKDIIIALFGNITFIFFYCFEYRENKNGLIKKFMDSL